MSLQNTFKTWYVSGTIWVRLNGDLLSEYIFLYLSFWLSMLIFEGKDYCLTNTPQSLSVQMNIYIFNLSLGTFSIFLLPTSGQTVPILSLDFSMVEDSANVFCA